MPEPEKKPPERRLGKGHRDEQSHAQRQAETQRPLGDRDDYRQTGERERQRDSPIGGIQNSREKEMNRCREMNNFSRSRSRSRSRPSPNLPSLGRGSGQHPTPVASSVPPARRLKPSWQVRERTPLLSEVLRPPRLALQCSGPHRGHIKVTG